MKGKLSLRFIRRMRIACWISKATDIHSEYVLLIAFLRQQWFRESASILHLNIYCLALYALGTSCFVQAGATLQAVGFVLMEFRMKGKLSLRFVRRMRIACWISKATDIHSECVLLIAFLRQQ